MADENRFDGMRRGGLSRPWLVLLRNLPQRMTLVERELTDAGDLEVQVSPMTRRQTIKV
jgi:hypothetical protein